MSPSTERTAIKLNETSDTRLLAIATDHIRRFGHERITVVGIAEAAGMSHANIYRYFPSKTALIDAVSAEWIAIVEARLADIAGAPDPADDKFERMMFALARASRDRLEEEPALFEAYMEAVERNRHVARKHRVRVRSLLERVLEEGLIAGAFEAGDRTRALTLALDCLHRFVSPLSIRQDADMPRKAFDERLAVAIRATLCALAHNVA